LPIKYPDNYPSDWPAIALAVKEAADWTCQACGKQCTRPGEAYTGSRNVLTVAHLDPYSYDRDFACVAALCAPCHLRYDAPFGMMMRRRNYRRRQREAGQLILIPIARTI
jgi:hypothetical protein